MPVPVALADLSGNGQVVTVTAEGELTTVDSGGEKNVLARYYAENIAATTWVVLVDLSDTANFHHDATGRIDISYLSMQIDRPTNAVGAVHIGVVTRVDATNADVTFFAGLHFINSSDTAIIRSENFAPSQVKCGVTGGLTTKIVNNENVVNDTAIQTDVALASPRGAATVIPAVGDIVAQFQHISGGAYNASVRLFFHGQATA